LPDEVAWLWNTVEIESILVLVVLEKTNYERPGEQMEQEMNATKYGLKLSIAGHL